MGCGASMNGGAAAPAGGAAPQAAAPAAAPKAAAGGGGMKKMGPLSWVKAYPPYSQDGKSARQIKKFWLLRMTGLGDLIVFSSCSRSSITDLAYHPDSTITSSGTPPENACHGTAPHEKRFEHADLHDNSGKMGTLLHMIPLDGRNGHPVLDSLYPVKKYRTRMNASLALQIFLLR